MRGCVTALARANHPCWYCLVRGPTMPAKSEQGVFSMNKTDLINAIAEKAELTKADAGRALEAFFETVQKRSEEHTSELQSLMRISYAVFCLKKKQNKQHNRESTL